MSVPSYLPEKKYCRNWHLGTCFDCSRLPRFQRAGPSTSLDRSALGAMFAFEMLSQRQSNVKQSLLIIDKSFTPMQHPKPS